SRSSRPNCPIAASTRARHCRSSATSATKAAALPPSCSIIATVCSAASRRISTTSTCAPARANRIAAARPLPIPSSGAPPPVKIAVSDGVQRRRFLRVLAGLAVGATATARGEVRSVLVFAAASLKNALDAIADDWRRETAKHATISYAASSTLAKQIENGAPADLFISADRDWTDYLEQRKLIDPKSRVDLLGNKLVLIAPKDSRVELVIRPGFDIAALLGGGRLA